LERTVDIAEAVCDVLAEAHDLGIIHRDIKPANIFLHRTPRGEVVKVLDFGIAKLLGDSNSSLTLEEGILGTPAYMAPERLSGGDYDGRSDVYSVGIMLFQMVAGTMPFSPKTNEALAIAMAHLTGTPERLTNVVPGAPLRFEALLMSALRRDPEERPSAAELGRRLREVLADLSDTSTPLSSDDAGTAPNDATTLLADLSTSRLAFGFSDLLSPPDDEPVREPLPVRPPRDDPFGPWA
ncbi:MAG: serine/threonine-protein kinase, partial [Acidobacteriota bacterium]